MDIPKHDIRATVRFKVYKQKLDNELKLHINKESVDDDYEKSNKSNAVSSFINDLIYQIRDGMAFKDGDKLSERQRPNYL